MRTSDEDEGLGDDRNLEVGDHVEHVIIGGFDTRLVLEGDAKFIREEVGLRDGNHKGGRGQREVQALSHSASEDLSEVPTVWSH